VFASRACSGPIPLRLRTFCWGSSLRSQGSPEDSAFALRAGFFWCSLPELAPGRSRSACVLFVGDGACARREALKTPPLRCARDFFWCSLPKLATDRSRSAYVLFVEDRSYARRERGDRWSFRAGARGGLRVLTFQCSLRPGPACAFWGGQATCYKTAVDFDLQNVGPVRRRLSSELVDFACGSRVEDSVFLQYARTGMTPHDAVCECGVNDRRYAKISDRKLMTPT
jgi:hypothetical protein